MDNAMIKEFLGCYWSTDLHGVLGGMVHDILIWSATKCYSFVEIYIIQTI